MRRWSWPPARLAGAAGLMAVFGGCGLFADPPSGSAAPTSSTAASPAATTSTPEALGTSTTTTVDANPSATAPDGPAPEEPLLLRADLTGAASVPGPGDADGSARAILTSDGHAGELCFSLMPTNLAPVTGLHVHQGATGAEGPIVIDLTRPDTDSTRGCLDIPEGTLERIAAAPGDFYIEIHTAEPPGVAARGQLS